MRILHCSDIHECLPFNWEDLRGKRYLGCLNWLFHRRWSHHSALWLDFIERLQDEPPDILAITGDLAQLGTATEMSLAVQPLYDLEQLGVRILFVPGNHDDYIAHDQEAIACLNKIKADFNGGQDNASQLPVISSGNAEFILLSQVRPMGLTASGGFMAEEQWQALEELSKTDANGKTRIVLGHYPLCDAHGHKLSKARSLQDSPRLQGLLAKLGARLYLCGHIHKPFEIALPGDCAQLVAGSITSAGSFYEINLNAGSVTWERKSIL
ncbi:MAG: metallophosphoesterase [Planctomycetes bacterium]|nr:metallophosphoesterase [Planctomycetota bacterium]